MKSLSGLDGAFLHLETARNADARGVAAPVRLARRLRGDFHADIQQQMRKRLHLAPVFTRKLAPMPLQFANPVWVEEDKVDLDYHVQRVTLPRPGTQAQLEDCAGRLHSACSTAAARCGGCPSSTACRPATSAYYIKVHHAVLDGQAGVLLAQALFDVTAKPRPHLAQQGAARRASGPGANSPPPR